MAAEHPAAAPGFGATKFSRSKSLAVSTLAADITGAPATFTIDDGALFSADNFAVLIQKSDGTTRELIYVTSRSGDVCTIGTRAFDGSTQQDHDLGDQVFQVDPGLSITKAHDEIVALATTVGVNASLLATKNSTGNIAAGERWNRADASGGAITLTLPTAVGNSGQRWGVIKTDATANAVTIDGTGGQTINGAANRQLAVQYEFAVFQSDGTNWNVVGQTGSNVIAGAGLTKTGDTLDVGAGTGITVNANDVQINQAANLTWTGTHDFTGGTVRVPTSASPAQTAEGSMVWDSDDDKLTVGDGAGRKTMVNEDRAINTATGLTGGGNLSADRTINYDINALTADATPNGAADFVVTYDASAGDHKKVLLNDLPGGGTGASLTGNIILPAEAFVVPSVNGATQVQIAGTNYDYIRMNYADAVDRFSTAKIHMPEDWDGGALDVTLVWSDPGTTANNVVWVVAMDRVESGAAPDGSLTTAATITSTASTTVHGLVYATSAAITKPTGLAAGDVVFVRVQRDGDAGGDTLAQTASMYSLRIEYTRSTA